MALPITQVMAPRWNCLALLGVCDRIAIDNAAELKIERPAANWSFEIQRSDGWRRHLDPAIDAQPLRITLGRGRYRLLARGYGCGEDAVFPAVKIAGQQPIDERPVDDEGRNYAALLEELRDRRSLLYLALHFHSYQLLCWRRWLPERWLPEGWIRRRYLPAAAADTGFRYGALQSGERLLLKVPTALERTHISVVIFNRCSFPVHWRTLEPGEHWLDSAGPGTYLLRVAAHPQARELAKRVELEIEDTTPRSVTGAVEPTDSPNQ